MVVFFQLKKGCELEPHPVSLESKQRLPQAGGEE